MKPVKAFASCTARCASYGAAVLHILRHCRKMLHKSASRLCRKVYRRLQTITDQGMKKICPFLSVSVRICPYAKHNDCFCQNPFFSGWQTPFIVEKYVVSVKTKSDRKENQICITTDSLYGNSSFMSYPNRRKKPKNRALLRHRTAKIYITVTRPTPPRKNNEKKEAPCGAWWY